MKRQEVVRSGFKRPFVKVTAVASLSSTHLLMLRAGRELDIIQVAVRSRLLTGAGLLVTFAAERRGSWPAPEPGYSPVCCSRAGGPLEPPLFADDRWHKVRAHTGSAGAPADRAGSGRAAEPAVFPRDDADPEEIARRVSKVSRAAGLADSAVPLTGIAMGVEGAGVIDPITNWQTITRPKPLLEPADILGACDQAQGRLDGLILQAEAERPPTVGAEAMHPTVWGAAARLWRDGHFRKAVSGAAEAVVLM